LEEHTTTKMQCSGETFSCYSNGHWLARRHSGYSLWVPLTSATPSTIVKDIADIITVHCYYDMVI
jgi:hypothetical protein